MSHSGGMTVLTSVDRNRKYVILCVIENRFLVSQFYSDISNMIISQITIPSWHSKEYKISLVNRVTLQFMSNLSSPKSDLYSEVPLY